MIDLFDLEYPIRELCIVHYVLWKYYEGSRLLDHCLYNRYNL